MSDQKKMQKIDLSNFFITDHSEDEKNQKELEVHPNAIPLIIRKERKGRAGKIATLVEGFQGSEEYLKALCKELKQKLGVGGSVKDHVIIIQGDLCTAVAKKLNEMNYETKIATL